MRLAVFGGPMLALWLLLGLEGGAVAAEPVLLDRVAVRFWAPETGGASRPQFVTERVLAYEARIEALSAGGPAAADAATGRPPAEHHVRAALERHIAETLLAGLPMQPEPSRAELTRQAERARLALARRVGGRAVAEEAARQEGLAPAEVQALLLRQARASLYLDRMVTPMLAPSNAELRQLQPEGPAALRNKPFAEVRQALLDWYVAQRLSLALREFFQNARSRVHLELSREVAPRPPPP